MKLGRNARFSTICLHAGQEPDPSTGAIITPIYQTSTYVQEELGQHKGYEYARTQNPTRGRSRRTSPPSRAAAAAFAFASGMAAINAIASLLKSGDHVVVSDNVYGGTYRLFDKVLTRYRLSFTYVDTARSRRGRARRSRPRRAAVRRNAEQSGDAAHRSRAPPRTSRTARGLRLVVDNTFASPCLQRPIEFGADLVMHSTTKYLNGHSDSVGGVVIATRDDDIEWLQVRPERRRRDPAPVRLVAGAARHQDAAAADGAAQRQRPGAGAVPGGASEGPARLLPGAALASRSTSWRAARCAGSAACWRSSSARSRRRAAC